MDILTWIVVGLIAGLLASFVVGGIGRGLIGDILVGVSGAFIGGFIFKSANLQTPFDGLPGTIFVAFCGSVLLLFVIRLVQSRRGTIT